MTGGSSGIGKAAAAALLRTGMAVMICSRGQTRLAQAQAELSRLGCCRSRVCDVADPLQVAAMVGEVVSTVGRLDVVVNSAGVVGRQDSITELGDEEWHRVLAVNLGGPRNMIRSAAPHMAASGGGTVVSVASVNAVQAEPGMAAYGVSKAALVALTRYAACELAPLGIRVNAVAPGWVVTPMSVPALQQLGVLGQPLTCNMQRRAAAPEEVADVIAFLAGSGASYITGETVTVDGGQVSLMAQPRGEDAPVSREARRPRHRSS